MYLCLGFIRTAYNSSLTCWEFSLSGITMLPYYYLSLHSEELDVLCALGTELNMEE